MRRSSTGNAEDNSSAKSVSPQHGDSMTDDRDKRGNLNDLSRPPPSSVAIHHDPALHPSSPSNDHYQRNPTNMRREAQRSGFIMDSNRDLRRPPPSSFMPPESRDLRRPPPSTLPPYDSRAAAFSRFGPNSQSQFYIHDQSRMMPSDAPMSSEFFMYPSVYPGSEKAGNVEIYSEMYANDRGGQNLRQHHNDQQYNNHQQNYKHGIMQNNRGQEQRQHPEDFLRNQQYNRGGTSGGRRDDGKDEHGPDAVFNNRSDRSTANAIANARGSKPSNFKHTETPENLGNYSKVTPTTHAGTGTGTGGTDTHTTTKSITMITRTDSKPFRTGSTGKKTTNTSNKSAYLGTVEPVRGDTGTFVTDSRDNINPRDGNMQQESYNMPPPRGYMNTNNVNNSSMGLTNFRRDGTGDNVHINTEMESNAISNQYRRDKNVSHDVMMMQQDSRFASENTNFNPNTSAAHYRNMCNAVGNTYGTTPNSNSVAPLWGDLPSRSHPNKADFLMTEDSSMDSGSNNQHNMSPTRQLLDSNTHTIHNSSERTSRNRSNNNSRAENDSSSNNRNDTNQSHIISHTSANNASRKNSRNNSSSNSRIDQHNSNRTSGNRSLMRSADGNNTASGSDARFQNANSISHGNQDGSSTVYYPVDVNTTPPVTGAGVGARSGSNRSNPSHRGSNASNTKASIPKIPMPTTGKKKNGDRKTGGASKNSKEGNAESKPKPLVTAFFFLYNLIPPLFNKSNRNCY